MGIFPWFNDDEMMMWFSPPKRFVLYPDKIKISTSMKKIIRSDIFTVTVDKDFNTVVKNCSEVKRKGQNGTWITKGMKKAYSKLHELGHAHSIEVWKEGKLVGGLYGVKVARVFCGESMFSLIDNASKAALIHLATKMNFDLIDCQVHTKHLQSMGAQFITRDKYQNYLSKQGFK